MSANVVQLDRQFRRSWDWAPNEVAEFYRVESALIQAGLKIDTERGISDEGDPWFAFCRPDDGEVIVHIARIGGLYVLAGPSYEGVSTGRDIASLVRDLVGRHPLIQTRGNNAAPRSNIFMHPAALLIAVVATAFFKSTEARALTDDNKSVESRSGAGGTSVTSGQSGVTARTEPVSAFEAQKTVVMDAVQSAVILSAIAAVLQAPTTYASEQSVTNATAAASDLLDFGALSLTASHSLSAVTWSAGPDTQELGSPHYPLSKPAGIALLTVSASGPAETEFATPANPDAHPVATEALPLVVVLWDLPASRSVEKTIAHESNVAAAAPTVNNSSSTGVQAPVVTFKLALANQPNTNESMPVVQTAKVTYAGNQGAVESQTISGPAEISKILVGALKDSPHTKIDAQPFNLTATGESSTSGSFAATLVQSLSDHAVGTKLLGAATSALTSVTMLDAATPTSSTVNAAKANDSTVTAAKAPDSTVNAPKAVDSTVHVASSTASTADAATPASQPPKSDLAPIATIRCHPLLKTFRRFYRTSSITPQAGLRSPMENKCSFTTISR